jgi:hypothetical protein
MHTNRQHIREIVPTNEEFGNISEVSVVPEARWTAPFTRPADDLILTDAMGRQLYDGDIITWQSGGYYSNYISFGRILAVRAREIKVINHNKKKITKWITYNTIILARYPNYELIPEKYQWLCEA